VPFGASPTKTVAASSGSSGRLLPKRALHLKHRCIALEAAGQRIKALCICTYKITPGRLGSKTDASTQVPMQYLEIPGPALLLEYFYAGAQCAQG
jgi:hypothetical protein